MNIVFYSAKNYERSVFEEVNPEFNFHFDFLDVRLDARTAGLVTDQECVCAFVNDLLNVETLEHLHDAGVRLIALRCAGFNHVDLTAAQRLGMTIVRVPAYSPYAVAEHTIALLLALNRKVHRAYNRIRENNFALDGLQGFDLNGRTAGVVGTGKIGVIVTKILIGFGCRVLAYDPYPYRECADLGAEFVDLTELFRQSDIITLHCPLNPQTHHLINSDSIAQMKDGVMLLNTSRGALVDTRSVTQALKTGKIGYLGLDVYEEEGDLFFQDLSSQIMQDDVFARLTTFPNVIITGHQAFFTREAMLNIARTTLENIREFEQGNACKNQVSSK